MKTNKTPRPVTHVISFEPEKHIVTLTCCVGHPTDQDSKTSVQEFNLDILPMSMVMTNICQLLMPTK